MNTIELLKIIVNALHEVHPRVYQDTAPSDAVYPYIVYELSVIKNELRYDATLTLDVWDKNRDATQIETLCDNIDKVLDMSNRPNELVKPTFFLESRQPVFDTNIEYKRRQLRYTIQTYF